MSEQLAILRAGAADLGLSLSESQLALFQRYYELLVEWNERVNLTAITDYEQVQVRHFLDSLTLAAALYQLEMRSDTDVRQGRLPEVLRAPEGRGIIDLGSGGGVPGLPLKIFWPQVVVTLVDSVGKKTNFLKQAAAELGLAGVEVVTGRAEALGQDKRYRGRYGVVTARAVAALPVLAEYGLPLARVGGLVLAPKKGDVELELEDARFAVRKLGGRDVQALPFTLPGDEAPRLVVAMPKLAATPPGYPRRVGLPDKKPLGRTAPDQPPQVRARSSK